MARANKLGDDLRRDSRKLSFLKLLLAIGTHSLDDTKRILIGERIANGLADGSIRAREATLLTRQLNQKRGR